MANPYFIKIELPAESNQGAMAGSGIENSSAESAIGGAGADKVLNKVKGLVSFSAIKSTADTIINYEISTVSLQTGATEYEQRLSTGYSVLSQTVGAVGSLVGAAVVGGPAGAAVAAIGLAVSGVHKVIGIMQKERTLQLQQNLENVSIGMANIRAGTAGRRSTNQ